MSKHRRPSRFQRLAHVANGPLQLGVAAGVAGTLGVTGTVVASVAGGSQAADAAIRAQPVAQVAALTHRSTAELATPAARGTLHHAIAVETAARQQALVKAHAHALAVRAAARRKAAVKRAHAKAVAQAAQNRSFASTVSRGSERMTASASHALALAAAAASGAYYVHGGAGTKAFDCSGFTMFVFAQMGISLPHLASAQAGVATRVSTPQPGDLVFVYNGGGGSIGHVAIYAGGGMWWEASNPSSGVGLHRAWSSAVSYGRLL